MSIWCAVITIKPFLISYKISHYTIFTDPFETDNLGINRKQVAFSTRTSKALLLSEKICQDLQSQQWDLILPEIMNQLTEFKFVVPEDENELNIIIDENRNAIEDAQMLYYVIQPTAFCQLGCDYCGQDHKKNNLSVEYFDKIIERIKSRISPGKHKYLRIGWFGAEPLVGLKEIRLLTPLLKSLADEFDLRYSSKIVTNGLSLKPDIYKELIEDIHVDHIEVTLDGVAEFHDHRRHTKSSFPTFDIIYQNLLDITNMPDYDKKRCTLSIRCNVDERNYKGVSPLIKMLADTGLRDKIHYFYPIGVYSWGNDAHKKSLTKEEFAEKEIEWLMEMYDYGFRPNLIPGRVREVCLAVSSKGEMIDAYGNIFNCTEVSYVQVYENTEYVLGNLKNDPKESSGPRPLSNWNEEVLNDQFPCTTCKMLPVCGGACPKSWHEGRRACPPNKFNIRDKLVLAYLSTKDKFLEILHDTPNINS